MTGGNRDIWMTAYTPEISVAVWMGYDQTDAKHKISNGITGGRNTASLAAAFFKKAYADREKPDFSQPDGLVWLTLDKRALTSRGSIMLASDKTPKEYRLSEVFAASNWPYAVSDIWQAPDAPSPSMWRIMQADIQNCISKHLPMHGIAFNATQLGNP